MQQNCPASARPMSRTGWDADGGVPMQLKIPDFSLVLMMGASGSGKSTFAAKHFRPTEIVSSDHCRGFVADDEAAQAATADALDVLY
jgi:protein phosphatase